MTKKETIIVLLSITFCWSSSYIFIKDLSGSFSTYAYLALTSGVAGIMLALIFHSQLKILTLKNLIPASILSVLITGNIFFEKLALDNLSASAVSALATMNIVIVPLILMLKKQFPSRNNVAGVIIIILGLYLAGYLNAQGEKSFQGIVYIFLSALMMSLYTVLATDYTQNVPPLLLTILQLCITGLIGLVLWIILEPGTLTTINWSVDLISYIVIIAFFSKGYAYLMLMYAEKYADAITITVIAATDPLVTLALAILIPGAAGSTEIFSLKSLIGALVIGIGAVVASTDFLSPKKDKKEEAAPQKPEDNDLPTIDQELTFDLVKIRRYAFIVTAGTFALLGSTINMMSFAGGFSSVRPENFIPVVAGILFGPYGALGCAVGNVISDINHDYRFTAMLIGLVGNFLAAYFPYKIWQCSAGEKAEMVHVHSWKNMIIYFWAAIAGCLATSWVLYNGLELFFKDEYISLFYGTFINNLVFSVMFGLPVLIVMTLTDSHGCTMASTKRPACGLKRLGSFSPHVKKIYILDTILLSLCLFADMMKLDWDGHLSLRMLNLVTAVVLFLSLLIPTPSQTEEDSGRESDPKDSPPEQTGLDGKGIVYGDK